MCRYSFHKYKLYYVCFDCRKTFKQYPTEDLIIRDGHWDAYRQAYITAIPKKAEEFRARNPKLVALFQSYFERRYPCPQCGHEMYNIGRDFKAPPQQKVKEWEIVRSLYTLGHAFSTCGCYGPGFIPRNREDHLRYLQEMKAHYEKKLAQRDQQTPDELANYLSYWQQKSDAVQTELNRLAVA